MERSRSNRMTKPRLWMKVDRRDEGNSSIRRPGEQPRIIYRSSPRPRTPKKGGATGLGFRLNVTVCPKVDQIFLAFSTILLIASLDLLVLTIVNVGPGILSQQFSPATCKIVEKTMNYSTYCYVSSLDKTHGQRISFKCLQVYISLTDSTNTINDDVTTEEMTSQSETVVPPMKAMKTQQKQEKFQETLLLYQNEFHLVGGDYANRPCSFLPDYCVSNVTDIDQRVVDYSDSIGDVNNTINCHFSATSGLNDITASGVAMRFRKVTVSHMVHSILWPIVGVFVSVLCCSVFWKKNHHRAHRLFIYNAWSPS